MPIPPLPRLLALVAGLALAGCGKPLPTEVVETPPEVISPKATDEVPAPAAEETPKAADTAEAEMPKPEEPAPAVEAAETGEAAPAETTAPEAAPAEQPSTEEPAPPAEEPKEPAPPAEEAEAKEAGPTASDACGSAEPATVPEAKLEKLSFDELKKAIVASKAKYTIVDCWASWCGPCKENFPHVLEMNEKYGEKGLKVMSCSFDGGTGEPEFDDKEIAAAKAFLSEKKAEITNVLLAEDRDQMFEKFDISTIPAVFVYDANGREVKRYTWDDPNNQFTYEQVEKEVAAMLGSRP